MNKLLLYLYLIKRVWQKRKEFWEHAGKRIQRENEERHKLYAEVDAIIERQLLK